MAVIIDNPDYEEHIANGKLMALLKEVESILSIKYRKSAGLKLSEETVERLRDFYIDYERYLGRNEYSLAELQDVFIEKPQTERFLDLACFDTIDDLTDSDISMDLVSLKKEDLGWLKHRLWTRADHLNWILENQEMHRDEYNSQLVYWHRLDRLRKIVVTRLEILKED